MKLYEYKSTWEKIDSDFNKWWNFQEWEEQEKYLRKKMKSLFLLKNKELKEIFDKFNSIFLDDPKKVSLEWEEYQFPTLVSITFNFIDIYK